MQEIKNIERYIHEFYGFGNWEKVQFGISE